MQTVLVSGASVAGPAVAYWLIRHGFDVTVVERAPAIREGGYAVDIRGAALTVLEQMGLLEAVRAQETDTLFTSFLDPDGESVAKVDRGFGVISADDIEIMRGDLVRVLYEATRRHAHYRFGDSIRGIVEQRDGVHVQFESGANERFDYVIGADGIHSNVRRLVLGDEAPFLSYLGTYMAVFTAPNHMGLDRFQLMYSQPGKVVSAKSTRGNVDLKVTMFFSSPPLSVDYRDTSAQKAIMRTAFEDSGWELPRFLDAMDNASDFYFDSTSQVRLPTWASGRVAFLGDACACPSPLTGQGTSLALVEAFVLAAELARCGGDHQAAFKTYEERVRPFAERNQFAAANVAKGFTPETARALWWRNASFKMLKYMPWKNLIVKLAMREVTNASKAISLDVGAP